MSYIKILSVAIPCFNATAYMKKAIDSIIECSNKIEIIIINDGSSDDTLAIAKSYQEVYPHDIIVIDQVNKGHGGAVNSAINVAKAPYFKVLDSDDWLDTSVLNKIINYLENSINNKINIDALILNYVYEKQGVKHKKIVSYHKYLQVDTKLSWTDIKFKQGTYLMMHSFIHKTSILKENVLLPEHTYYVDNLLVSQAALKIEDIYYLDETLYHYFIGREDQSVNEKVMIKRIDQQLKVNKELLLVLKKAHNQAMESYLFDHFAIITSVSLMMLLIENNSISKSKKRILLQYIKDNDINTYKKLNKLFPLKLLVSNNILSHYLCLILYKVLQKIYQFN